MLLLISSYFLKLNPYKSLPSNCFNFKDIHTLHIILLLHLGRNFSEDIRSTTPAVTKHMCTTPTFFRSVGEITVADILGYQPVANSQSVLGKNFWVNTLFWYKMSQTFIPGNDW